MKPLITVNKRPGSYYYMTECKISNYKNIVPIKISATHNADYFVAMDKIATLLPKQDFFAIYKSVVGDILVGHKLDLKFQAYRLDRVQSLYVVKNLGPIPNEMLVKCRYPEQAILLRTMLCL